MVNECGMRKNERMEKQWKGKRAGKNGRREERHLGEKSETSSPSIQLAILLCPQIALFILASDDTA
jgi:hypothetical protein